MKYRKKPIVIEAVQLKVTNVLEVESFIEDKKIELNNFIDSEKFDAYKHIVIKNGRQIKTLEGVMTANVGDFIIKGVNGEFYPCKPDIFEKTYELVEGDDI